MNNNLIPGIYLYCDRWCERCAFASRCEGYAAPRKLSDGQLKEQEEKNRLFWLRLSENLPQAVSYIQKAASEKGIDLLRFENIPRQVKFDLFQRKAVSNDVLKAGRRYEDKVDDLLDELTEQGVLVFAETELGGAFRFSGEMSGEPEKQWVNDVLAVIVRYQLQLYLKISRAYYSRGKAAEESAESKSFSDDALGVVKSTAELIDRSLSAWFVCLNVFPDRFRSGIEEILFLLTAIKNNLLKEFPAALSFVRPGLDKV